MFIFALKILKFIKPTSRVMKLSMFPANYHLLNQFSFKYFFVFISLLCFNIAIGQSNPAPASLPLTQNFSSLTGAAPTYPASFQGWDVNGSLNTSFSTLAPSADRAIIAGSNSNSAGIFDMVGKMGVMCTGSSLRSICLAINTTGMSNITLSYLAATQYQIITGTPRINELGMQYRIGTTGSFTNISGTTYQNNNAVTNTAGTGSINPQTISTTLPSAVENQAVVQLRWIIRDVSGSGNRPGFSIDDISISAPAVPIITSTLTSTATFNTPYTYTVTASNTPTSFSASGLPSGLSIDPASGIISGTPATGTASATPYAVMLSATNAIGTGNVTLNLTVNKANQTITFGALANVLDTDPNFTLTGSASSGLAVSYSSSMPSIAAIIAPDMVDPIAPGMTVITASQAGDADYNAATNVDQNLTIVNSAATPQTITFTLTSPQVYTNALIPLIGTATSMLPVSYTSSDTMIVKVIGSDLKIKKVGTVMITASQAGDATYAAAPNVLQTLVISPKELTVTGALAQSKTYNGTTAATIIGATLTGVINSDVVTLSAANATFDTPDAGTGKPVMTNYTLSGANAANYTVAQPSGLSADITKANQTIVFSAIPSQSLTAGTYTFTATTNSSLPITYASSNMAVATVSGSVATLVMVGSTNITASQAGDNNYNAAVDVVRSLNVIVAPAMYNFGTTSSTALPTSGIPISDLTFSAVGTGNSLISSVINSTSPSSSAGASGFNNAGVSAKNSNFSPSVSAYFEVTITPAVGKQVKLDSIAFASRSTPTGPTSYTIYSNIDEYSVPFITGTFSADNSWANKKHVLTTSLSNFNQPITLRIYGFATGGAGNATAINWRIDDLALGAIAIPLPSPCAIPTMNITTASTPNLCKGESILLTASGASSYKWLSPLTATTDTVTVLPNANTSYIVKGIGPDGCFAYDTISIMVTDTVVLNNNNGGAGSLRKAIACAAGGKTILISASVTSPINLTQELNINKNLTIGNPSGSNTINVDFTGITNYGINIATGKTVTMRNLLINNLNNTNALPLIQTEGNIMLKNVSTK